MKLWYISFATETEFLGSTVVEGLTETQALDIATNNGLNPGGQAAILEVPSQLSNAPDIGPLKYKLFSKEQMETLGARRHGDLESHEQLILKANAVSIDQ